MALPSAFPRSAGLTRTVQVRFPYVVEARIGSERKSRTRTTSAVAPVQFAVVAPDAAPVVARLSRKARLPFGIAGPDTPRIDLTYRLAGGVLMRSMICPGKKSPLVADDIERLDAPLDGDILSWADHPVTCYVGEFGLPEGNTPSRIFFQPEVETAARIDVDGRDFGLVHMQNRCSEIVEIDGILYRPALPPALGVYQVGNTVHVGIAIPELENARFCGVNYGVRPDEFSAVHAEFYVDSRHGEAELRQALSEAQFEFGSPPDTDAWIECDDFPGLGKIDALNVELMQSSMRRFVKRANWSKADPDFMIAAGRIRAALRDAHPSAASGVDFGGVLREVDAAWEMIGPPAFSPVVADVENFRDLAAGFHVCGNAAARVQAATEFRGFAP